MKLPLMYKFCSNSWQMLLRSRTVFVNASLIILFCLETNMSELCPELTFFTVCLFRSVQLRLGFEIMKLIHSNLPAFQLKKILIGHSRIQRSYPIRNVPLENTDNLLEMMSNKLLAIILYFYRIANQNKIVENSILLLAGRKIFKIMRVPSDGWLFNSGGAVSTLISFTSWKYPVTSCQISNWINYCSNLTREIYFAVRRYFPSNRICL